MLVRNLLCWFNAAVALGRLGPGADSCGKPDTGAGAVQVYVAPTAPPAAAQLETVPPPHPRRLA